MAEPVRARIAANVLPVAKERVRLRTSVLGDDATLVGAAELGFSALMADPLGVLARAAAQPVTAAGGLQRRLRPTPP